MRFNPWLFAGASDLISRFFNELGQALGKENSVDQAKRLSRAITKYADALGALVSVVPAVGSAGAVIFAALGRAGKSDPASPQRVRDDLARTLRKAEQSIVVIIDDLDRLADPEIREIVRLVKLVGDLPWMSYLLCYDRERVEDALGAGFDGRGESVRVNGRKYLVT